MLEPVKFKLGAIIRDCDKELIQNAINEIEQKKYNAFMNRLKELNIVIIPEIEQHRKFKRFARETRGDEETIYYDDGSLEGLRVITFKTTPMPFDPEKPSIGYNVSYY